MIKPHYTNRKFYGKWLYKITLKIPGITVFRLPAVTDLQGYFLRKNDYLNNNHKSIIDLYNFLSGLNKGSYGKRIERDSIDIYVNDEIIFTNMIEKFKNHLVHAFVPNPGIDQNNISARTIVANKYPHDKYQYKVFLQPHKLAYKKEVKIPIVQWMSSQPGIKITNTVKKWFMDTDWNWDRRYIYVETEGDLLMLKLRCSEVVGSVFKYEIIDK